MLLSETPNEATRHCVLRRVLGHTDYRRVVVRVVTRCLVVMVNWGHLTAIVDEQAMDDGLWAEPESIVEAYLQSALRRLHAAIEAAMNPKVVVTINNIDREGNPIDWNEFCEAIGPPPAV